MVEVEEIELDLGLSIGGCFFREEKSKPEGFHSDLQRGGSVVVDDRQPHDHHKREIQAMEAKKKREHKREREVMEPECQRVWKKEKTDNCVNGVSAWTTPFQVQQSAQQYGTVQYMCWVGNNNKDVGRIDGVNNVADGSSRCSSSAVSDYQTSSREDGGSSDSLSHSTHSLTEPTQLINSSNINMRNQPEQSASSHPMKKSNAHQRNHIVKDSSRTHQCITQSKPMDPKEEEAITNTTTHQKLLLVPNDNSSIRVEMGNSDKPVSVICSSSLPQMPYVSTMGNGPNGKTVNGFLYRYSSKSEVSIVCVCHGSTFSPAEFVQHAGGTDISHPLKHITVIPSAFA